MSIDVQVAEAELIRLRREDNQADVRLSGTGEEFYRVPIFYHCSPTDITHGWKAFYVGDTVLVADVDSISERRIVGFADGKPRRCQEGRFFAKVNTDEGIKYYWLFFNSGVFAQEVDAKFVLNLDDITIYPTQMLHLGAKAFELLDSESVPVRYVGSTHILTKDRKIIFQPIVWPGEDIFFPESTPEYICPEWCLWSAIGYSHPCPPNGFYVNVEEKIMTWYAPGWGIELGTLIEHTFLNGVTLNIPSIEEFDPEDIDPNTVESYYVECYDAEDEGFPGFWFYKPVASMIYLEVSANSVWDVDELHADKISLFMQAYNNRPLRAEKTFGGGTTFEMVEKTYHRQWTKEGFKQVDFASTEENLNEEFKSQTYMDSADYPPVDCGQYTNEPSCESGCFEAYGIGHCSACWERVDSAEHQTKDNYSKFTTHFLDLEYWTESLWREGYIFELKRGGISVCMWETIDDICRYSPPPTFPSADIYARRDWTETVQQRFSNGVSASFLLPNVVWTPYVISRRQITAIAEQWGYKWPVGHVSDAVIAHFLDPCSFRGISQHILKADNISLSKCFLKFFPMPGDDWIAITKDYLDGDRHWHRHGVENHYLEINQDTVVADSNTGADKFIVSAIMCSRIYYLDDRSTFEGQGLVVANVHKYTDPETEEKIPDLWQISWTPQDDVVKQDVTMSVLEALECDCSELLELGLV
ncbi:MAG: hypothetical protein U9R60_16340 [Bacteroidota bacterium]|nr:hypothetical protein [Bacteroidota bacterium]